MQSEFIIFLDECILGLEAPLRELGFTVVRPFERGMADVDWIAEVGKLGYIAITRDRMHSKIERAAVRDSGCKVFVFPRKPENPNIKMQLITFVRGWPVMQERSLAGGPFLCYMKWNGNGGINLREMHL